jgi:hypothetical protein
VRRVQLGAILEQVRNLRHLAPGDHAAQVRELAAIDAELTKAGEGPRAEELRQRRSEILVPVPFDMIVRDVTAGEEPRLEFANRVAFHGFSAVDPNRLRGPGFDFVWLDEAEDQKDEAFSTALGRQRSAECIRAVVTSSPRTDGWLYSVISGEDPKWNAVRETTAVRVSRWTSDDNTHNQPAVLTTIRAVTDATQQGLSKQELDGRFVGTSEAPGPGPFNWARAFCGPITLTHHESRAAVLGVDLAQKHDFTWLTVLSETGVVLAMERFNESTVAIDAAGFFPYVHQKICDLVNVWGNPLVKVDPAWTGASVSQFLARDLNGRARVEGFKTDQQGARDAAIEGLGVAVDRGSIRIPTLWTGHDGRPHPVEHVEQLRLEFTKLLTVTEGFKRHFRHPSGGHDDGVISLALAWDGIRNKPARNAPNPFGPLPPRSRKWDHEHRRTFQLPNVTPPWRNLPPSPWRR